MRALAVASALAVALAVSSTTTALAARVSGKLVPSTGTLMGAFVNPTNSTTLSTTDHENLVLQYESTMGRRLDVEMWYYLWGNAFWNGAPKWDLANGRIPMVKYGAGGGSPSLDAIANGSQDATLRAMADGVKSMGGQIFFCPFWEMNGDWEPWSGANNNDSGTYDGPLKYVKAWRHMHDVFVQRGATNAVWVWAPDKGDSPKENWNHWLKYYPGDDYVDWVGLDGYNWGSAATWSRWTSWEETFRAIYDDFAARKPIMIAETASAELGGDKAQWMADAQAVIKDRFPDVASVTWFDDNKETDWRVDSSPAALSAYRTWAADPYFATAGGGTAPSSLSLPRVSGRPKAGVQLSAAAGSWANAPTSVAYQWKRCNLDGGACTAITGATALTYNASSGDVDHTLRLFATARNASGSGVVASDPTAPIAPATVSVPAPTRAPVLSGAYEEGTTLRGTNGVWTGAPTSLSYQWRRCDAAGSNCSDITGATTSSYALGRTDVGRKLKLRVRATNEAGTGSATVTTRLVYGAAPASTAVPTLSGGALQGVTLTASAGTWSGSPSSYLYRWRRCDSAGANCIDIAGASAASYALAAADVGHTVRAEVTASNQWGSTAAESPATALVTATG